MYYPYLRSKQNEMLALKELLPIIIEKKVNISPIIEPVGDWASFKNLLNDFQKNNINFTVVINPAVWEFIEDIDSLISILEIELNDFENYQVGVLVNDSTISYHQGIIERLQKSSLKYNWYTLIHNVVISNIDDLLSLFNAHKTVVNNVIDLSKTNSDRSYKDKFPLWTQICFDDYFKAQSKNADYLWVPSSIFSRDYISYASEWFKWFGDFLTIWDKYSDSGFSPYAVAIHISYKEEDNNIYVRHFASDSNTDTSNTAGKFLEANTKLNARLDREKISITKGLQEFKELYARKHFPWLGFNKKLSIMNHIELILKNI